MLSDRLCGIDFFKLVYLGDITSGFIYVNKGEPSAIVKLLEEDYPRWMSYYQGSTIQRNRQSTIEVKSPSSWNVWK